jgi:lysophospholipase L1-like esterase
LRIIIFSDSLGRPRPDLEEKYKTDYEDVYGYIIKKRYPEHDVDIIYIESLDTNDAVFWSERMVAFRKPDIVLFHLGINDCTPRLFKKNSHSFILKPWFRKMTRNVFLRLLSKYRFYITKYLRKTYVTEENFKKNFLTMINKVKEYNKNCLFYTVSISETNSLLAQKSCYINENIVRYNHILKDIFKTGYIEVNLIFGKEERLIDDGVHLTKKAHALLAGKIMEFLEKDFPI